MSDPCVYRNAERNLIVGLYVDDLALWGGKQKIERFKSELSKRVEIRSYGQMSLLLSLKIVRESATCVSVSQATYTQQILRDFGMDQSKTVTSPLGSSSKDVGDPRNDEPFNEHVYRKLIGSLLYLSTNTRPDIAFAVSYLSQFCSEPSQKNWVEAKRVLRYVNGTVDFKLTYVRGGKPVEIFCDADWANNADRKSFSGFVTKLAGAAVT